MLLSMILLVLTLGWIEGIMLLESWLLLLSLLIVGVCDGINVEAIDGHRDGGGTGA